MFSLECIQGLVLLHIFFCLLIGFSVFHRIAPKFFQPWDNYWFDFTSLLLKLSLFRKRRDLLRRMCGITLLLPN